MEEAAWDEKVDGPWDPSKVVEEKIDGKMRKGIYKLVGRRGVWVREQFEGTQLKDIG